MKSLLQILTEFTHETRNVVVAANNFDRARAAKKLLAAVRIGQEHTGARFTVLLFASTTVLPFFSGFSCLFGRLHAALTKYSARFL